MNSPLHLTKKTIVDIYVDVVAYPNNMFFEGTSTSRTTQNTSELVTTWKVYCNTRDRFPTLTFGPTLRFEVAFFFRIPRRLSAGYSHLIDRL